MNYIFLKFWLSLLMTKGYQNPDPHPDTYPDSDSDQPTILAGVYEVKQIIKKNEQASVLVHLPFQVLDKKQRSTV